MESFYINLELNGNETYDFSDVAVVLLNKIDGKITVTIAYALVSFFYGTYQMYSFICRYKDCILAVESLKENVNRSIRSFDVFIMKMYDLWRDKIKKFHSDYGRFLIGSNSAFYKNYKKIRKFMYKTQK